MTTARLSRPAAVAVACGVLLATACTPNATAETSEGAADGLTVTSTADECAVSAATAESGPLTFAITNEGDQVTEFYLLAEDGLRIVSEVENIGPGISRNLVVNARPGSYYTVCKPGMVGDGVGRTAFTVTDSGTTVEASGDEQAQIDDAVANYEAYVEDQVDQLLDGTEDFAAAYSAGDDDEARRLYPTTRMHFERVEPVAESFGDLDPKLDNREADLAEGEEWTGWHRIEKDLWPPADPPYTPLTPTEREVFADQLVEDTTTLRAGVQGVELTLDQLANGAIALMDEVANGKVTGEEEIWSGTDLWDFQGNVEGARVLVDGLRDLLDAKDPELAATLDEDFASLEAELDKHRTSPDGAAQRDITYVSYGELSQADVKALSDRVNALSEPLSRITASLLG
ncbi:EfeM/EfeO family lipoprotein [Arthrobacter agilis]|uniref:iron uptake system protein EfeO n=1 Tax=Arthrobacter agilis TaxID=37921 RepID=UPI000B35697D|nr:iron uptake system protein EfeO [Arthrobacter agilis]OUM42281.1 PbrT family lead (Pb2+) uptake porter [Arthrobacter agilis]PPB45623.1 EfeM/EfeO family lipoprotein [Arthrobacter agilis]TPV26396.1 EfeM/EfeO family lipoprotein [Arthrobacter agilis]VDR33711.1 Iron uptake system component EfeO precursor [Arthrobacter agilis]